MGVFTSDVPSKNCLNVLNPTTKGIDTKLTRKKGRIIGNNSSGCPRFDRLIYSNPIAEIRNITITQPEASPFLRASPILNFCSCPCNFPIIGVSP